MKNTDSLTALPYAHRGLHDNQGDAPENTMLAFEKALQKGFAIECDVKLAKDGEVVVFHDDDLKRLCNREGRIEDFASNELATFTIMKSKQIIPRLSELLHKVDGRVPLVVELKSFDHTNFERDGKLEQAVLDTIRDYVGPLTLKSFNPFTVEFLKSKLHAWPVGFLSCNYEKDDDLRNVLQGHAASMTNLTAKAAQVADFISYSIDDLTPDLSQKCRSEKKPLMVWTVRTKEQFIKARQLADNIVFEWPGVQHRWRYQTLD